MKDVKKDILWRIYLLFFIIALLGVAVVGQAFRIQVVHGDHYQTLADSLTTTYKTIPAERGNIFSEDGRLLATSLPYFDIRMDVNATALTDDIFYGNVDSLALCMSRFFKDHTQATYKARLVKARKEGERYLLIKRRVTFPELQEMQQWPLFRLGRYKGGLIVEQQNKRKIPFGILAHRTIGYVRTGPNAKSVGLEAAFNKELSGINGKRLMQKVGGSSWVPINDRNEIEPKNGSDIITTIDINIQDVTEHALLKALKANGADHGCAIVMEVATGKIKAIANLGMMADSNYWERYNYAVGEAMEPGSTFKLATMMALLEDDFVDPEDSVDIGYGQVWYSGTPMKDSEAHNHGMVSVQHAFEISSNVGISKLATKYYAKDADKLVGHLRNFGLDQKTGIEIKGEGRPLIKSPGDEGWSGLSVPWMSVGYEVKLTPLQMLTFYNAVANNGKMMKPYLVSSISEFGKPVAVFEPQVVKEQIASAETIAQARNMLEGVVENGTARSIRCENVTIAGKTGTAQIADKKHGYKKTYQASFAGYFPADNPVYSCIVVVYAPSQGRYYGGAVAGPVFKEIAEKVYANTISIQQPEEEEESVDAPDQFFFKGNLSDYNTLTAALKTGTPAPGEGEWGQLLQSDDRVQRKAVGFKKNVVPDVKNMGLRDAIYLLETSGLRVMVRGKGKVVKQSRKPGESFKTGEFIIIELS